MKEPGSQFILLLGNSVTATIPWVIVSRLIERLNLLQYFVTARIFCHSYGIGQHQGRVDLANKIAASEGSLKVVEDARVHFKSWLIANDACVVARVGGVE